MAWSWGEIDEEVEQQNERTPPFRSSLPFGGHDGFMRFCEALGVDFVIGAYAYFWGCGMPSWEAWAHARTERSENFGTYEASKDTRIYIQRVAAKTYREHPDFEKALHALEQKGVLDPERYRWTLRETEEELRALSEQCKSMACIFNMKEGKKYADLHLQVLKALTQISLLREQKALAAAVDADAVVFREDIHDTLSKVDKRACM